MRIFPQIAINLLILSTYLNFRCLLGKSIAIFCWDFFHWNAFLAVPKSVRYSLYSFTLFIYTSCFNPLGLYSDKETLGCYFNDFSQMAISPSIIYINGLSFPRTRRTTEAIRQYNPVVRSAGELDCLGLQPPLLITVYWIT